MPPAGVLAGTLDGALALVPDTPGKHRFREDVVEDLVPATVVPAHDAVCPTATPRTGVTSASGTPAYSARSARLLRDLGSGRRHEVVEQPRGDVLLRRLQRREGALEVVGDDPAAAPEPVEGLDAELVPAGADLDLPQPLHHELEERRLDPRRPVGGRRLRLGADRR